MSSLGTCPCGLTLTSLRIWRSFSQERRDRHLAARDLGPHHGHGMCQRCYQKSIYRPHPRQVQKTCRVCAVRVVPNSVTPGEGERRHFGRGLCSMCYHREKRAGNLDLRPVRVQVAELRSIGLSLEQISDELGLPINRIRRAAA